MPEPLYAQIITATETQLEPPSMGHAASVHGRSPVLSQKYTYDEQKNLRSPASLGSEFELALGTASSPSFRPHTCAVPPAHMVFGDMPSSSHDSHST